MAARRGADANQPPAAAVIADDAVVPSRQRAVAGFTGTACSLAR